MLFGLGGALALAELGVQEVFWGVALRPGHPTWFGTYEDKLVFGLPGNPVSAMVTFAPDSEEAARLFPIGRRILSQARS